MTLRDLMDDDLGRVILDTDEFGESVTVTPVGQSSTFALTVAVSDVQQAVTFDDLEVADDRLQVTARRSTYRAGVQGITGTARDAKRGDTLTFTDHHAGDWVVEDAHVDVGGGQSMSLRRATTRAVGGRGALGGD